MKERQKRIKIFRIIARLNVGGPAIHTILLSHELDKHGYKTILLKGSEDKTEGDMMGLANSKGVKPIVIPELGREISLKNDLIAFFKLHRLIRREKPDIVHTHTAKAGTLGRLAAWLTGVPVIVHTFHGHVLEGYFGRLRSFIFIQIERIMAFLSTKIITLSNSLKYELLKNGIGSNAKIEVIPLGLELEKFTCITDSKGDFKRSIGVVKDCLLVGMVGRLVPIKGHRYFLDAVKKVIEREPAISKGVKFVIVGDGELRKELEAYSNSVGIEDSVIFTGFRFDLAQVYSDLDIVVLTSLNEGTPVSLIEAMASGKPVIATEVGGVKDLVKNKKTGFLVPPRDVEQLADRTIQLLKDERLRKVMGEEGRKAVYPGFSIETLVKNLNAFYLNLLNNKGLYI